MQYWVARITGSDYVLTTARGTPLLHHNVSKRVLRRAAAGGSVQESPLCGHELADRLVGRTVLEPHHEPHVQRLGEPLQRMH